MAAPKEDWQHERARVLAQARVVVVKVGSAVLTDADGLNVPVLENLAAQLASLRSLLPQGTAADAEEARNPDVWCWFLRGLWPQAGLRFRHAGMWLKPQA